MATRTRRTKEEVLNSKLTKIDEEIKKLTEKINALSEQKKVIDNLKPNVQPSLQPLQILWIPTVTRLMN